MVEVRWTLQSFQDLDAIAEFIARDSPQYARLFVVDIFQIVDCIAQFPESGRIVPELDDPIVREILFGNYRIVYQLKGGRVELLAIHHGARLLDPRNLE